MRFGALQQNRIGYALARLNDIRVGEIRRVTGIRDVSGDRPFESFVDIPLLDSPLKALQFHLQLDPHQSECHFKILVVKSSKGDIRTESLLHSLLIAVLQDRLNVYSRRQVWPGRKQLRRVELLYILMKNVYLSILHLTGKTFKLHRKNTVTLVFPECGSTCCHRR
jgi:hypothetical protein